MSDAIINTIEANDDNVIRDYVYDFIKAGNNDKNTHFPQTFDEMSDGVKSIYSVWVRTYAIVLYYKEQPELSDELVKVVNKLYDAYETEFDRAIELMNEFNSL